MRSEMMLWLPTWQFRAIGSPKTSKLFRKTRKKDQSIVVIRLPDAANHFPGMYDLSGRMARAIGQSECGL
jgi:hypothetical protein